MSKKKKRCHRLGSRSSQNVAVGQHNRADFEMLIQRKTELYPRNRRLFMGLQVYLRFFAKYACPGSHAVSPFFEHPFARLGCFGRDRWNLWTRRHNDEWICIERRLQTLRECFQSMRENPWFHFWMSCVLWPHFGLMIRRLTTLASAGRPTEGLFRVRTSGRAIRRARAKKAL